ncbi:MAG: hypothetical protein QOK39_2014 [Acidimicrobiaceae bacterium]|jgi:hypothetical protein|nr:hypothetical protein [Acidimicrobiaceae bacterium]
MSDPFDDRLRGALRAGGEDFSPAREPGTLRTELVARVRRRQRQKAALATGCVAVVLLSALAVGLWQPGHSSSRLVAASGAGASTTIGGGSPTLPVPAGDTGTTGVVGVPGGSGVTGTGVTGTGVAVTPTHPPSSPPTSAPTVTSSVSRPTTTVSTTAPPGSSVRGSVAFSPTCPVEKIPPDPACAPRPGPAHIELARADGSVAAQGDAGANGRFAITVAPGIYAVHATTLPSTPPIGRGCTATPASVTVTPASGASVTVSCDTGIR